MKTLFFKLMLFCSAILMTVGTAFASKEPSGVIGGTVILTSVPGEFAISDYVIGCDDPIYGHFDLCADMTLTMVRPQATLRMNLDVSKNFGAKKRRVLMRYKFIRAQTNPYGDQIIRIVTPQGNSHVVYLFTNNSAVVSRISEDGGQTWGLMKTDYR